MPLRRLLTSLTSLTIVILLICYAGGVGAQLEATLGGCPEGAPCPKIRAPSSPGIGGGCTVDQRINLGKQGYTPESIDQMCSHSESSPGDGGAWDKLINGFMGELGKGLSQELFKGNDESNNTAPIRPGPFNHAALCATNYGTCPLQRVPVGASCYCKAYNGFTAYGVAR
jgi:hypothetical protein